MSKQLHTYIFVLEVQPLEVGAQYDDLPSHCTLMHRFISDLSVDQIIETVSSLFSKSEPIALHFAEQEELGPKHITVNRIEMTDELKMLHQSLCDRLNDVGADYTAPEWVGDGYIAHVSKRADSTYKEGDMHVSKAVYLVEAKVPGAESSRFIRAKFPLV